MRKQPPYAEGVLDRVAHRLDGWASTLLQRLQRYVSRRWPRLGAWLSSD